ncbi:MAG: hypothetical protein QOG02_163 [Gaiellales bacterium]|nr:hypothetical protein [Gaiellales bacterium]
MRLSFLGVRGGSVKAASAPRFRHEGPTLYNPSDGRFVTARGGDG